ncbi:MAG: alpha/beta hydrolase [Gammaproteobacteria bacterium]|nr:alpha/beta hydrolase [Gammaproteobacteria bacterium]
MSQADLISTKVREISPQFSIQSLPNGATDEEICIKSRDDLYIYGVHAKSNPQNSSRAIIYLHGLTGDSWDPNFEMAKFYFAERGYDSIRIDLYSWQDDARRFHDSTLFKQSEDLADVIDHFKNCYKKIFIVGHSFGGLSAVYGNPLDVSAFSLWEPSYCNDERLFATAKPLQGTDWFYFEGGCNYLVKKNVIDEYLSIAEAGMDQFLNKINTPTQIISGAQGVLIPHHPEMLAALNGAREHIVVEGAIHTFREGNSVFELLENTHRWFEQW